MKCVKLKQRHSVQSLTQKIETVSKLRHRNLVSIIGHCTVTYQEHPNMATTIFIVFENISNGSLRNHLTGKSKFSSLCLSYSGGTRSSPQYIYIYVGHMPRKKTYMYESFITLVIFCLTRGKSMEKKC